MSRLNSAPRLTTTYPPTRTPKRSAPRQTSRWGRFRRSGRSRSSIVGWIWYRFSFVTSILVLAILMVISAYGIGDQAARRGAVGRGNIVVLAAAYTAVAVISAMFCWSRVLTIKRLLRTMPKPYMPTKYLDLDSSVADHIMSEYSRTAVIAHISQATTGVQEGWGRPGTKWADKHFRTEILSTLPELNHQLLPNLNNDKISPLSLKPLSNAAAQTGDKALILFVNSYIRLIEQARYARREPEEADADAVMNIVEVVRRTMEVRRMKEGVVPRGRMGGGEGKIFGEG